MTHAAPQTISIGALNAGDGAIVQTPILHLDAADADSYSGAGQQWHDISGHGNHFVAGYSASVEAADPSFVGTAGAKDGSCWMALDGDALFSAVAAHNGETLRNLGRSDIAQTFEYWLYAGASWPSYGVVYANHYSAEGSTPGLALLINNAGKMVATPYVAGSFVASAALNANAWNHVALTGRFDGATSCKHFLNGAANGSFTASSGHTSGDAYDKPRLGYNGGNFLPNGWRFAIVRIYDFALTEEQIAQNFNAQRWRYDI
ncbi:LamG-like jellyroll fold domain-containing protein [Ferrovibrio sp.]|uniref:LamG-like jellyroll fold domain-containing protein n=1 Tax=Ferrovibrio sp. TaxID=1917215 RepID=UPI0035B17B43